QAAVGRRDPRVLALAELTWSPASKKDFVDFSRRINNAYVRLDYHNIGYHIPQPEGVLTKNVVFTGDTVSLAFNNTRNYPMVYTTDGSQVTARSTQYTEPIVMKENGVVKIATLLQSGKLSVPRTIVVERESLAPAVNPDSSAMKNKPGQTIRARVAKGLFPNPKEYANAQWSKDTLLSSFQGIDFDYKAPSLAVYEGYVNLPEDGVYTFTTDMNELFIDGVRLIDNNSVASRHNNQKVQKALAAGKHAYKLVMNNMVQNGWPQSWNVVGFAYRLPSGGDFLMADPSIISY
ncbi:MAG: PA14 domain-containing protein, partial [Mucinivorans sp.]